MAGTPALGIQSGLLFEAWSPSSDPERQSALGGAALDSEGRYGAAADQRVVVPLSKPSQKSVMTLAKQ